MKIKINELKPNPFKKEINNGKLDEDTINKIQSNMKELGLMGALPVFKKDNSYFLIAGHHRVEAIKRQFGKDYEVEVIVHNYSEEQILRGMIVENLTQRNNEFKEELSNLLLIRKYLQGCSLSEQHTKGKRTDLPFEGKGNVRDISSWLNKQGEVMSMGKISNLLNIAENIHPDLLDKVTKATTTSIKNQGDIIAVKDAVIIASLPKNEQKDIMEAIKRSEISNQTKRESALTQYKNASNKIKDKVLKGEINLEDIETESIEQQITENNKNKEETKFIPNFQERLRMFSGEVLKLEQQVALFRGIFKHKSFYAKYNSLGSKDKKYLDNSIQGIQDRIKSCYDEVEYFSSQLLEAKKYNNKQMEMKQ